MGIQHTLTRFKSQQSGPVIFTRPDGVPAEVCTPKGRRDICSWIIDLFDGDKEAADEAASSVVPLAINRAGAPWPYLLTALYNRASERRTKFTTYPSPLEAVRDLKAKVSKSRRDLLGDVFALSKTGTVIINGQERSNTCPDDVSEIVSWLLGDDPYVLFYLLAPQHYPRYASQFGAQRIVDDIVSARFLLSSLTDEAIAGERTCMLTFLGELIASATFKNIETIDCLKLVQKFYLQFTHPLAYTMRLPRFKRLLLSSDVVLRTNVERQLRRRNWQPHDNHKSIWMRVATRLGIITNPLWWFVSVYTSADPTIDWMDFNWYDEVALGKAHGLIPIRELFGKWVTDG